MPLPKLYPLTFCPRYQEKIWGGDKIKTVLGRDFSPRPNCGESWEISAVGSNVSQVAQGPLQGKKLTALIKTYRDKLLGKKVLHRFGESFPLLIKFIDAKEDLSIQVHPNDDLARLKHGGWGKTEMWYVLQADPDSQLISGFSRPVSREEYHHHLKNKSLKSILNVEKVKAGDVFFLPAGRVHAVGAGILLAEIQQTSDITYRIYDWDRVDAQGKSRELHTEAALMAMDFKKHPSYKTHYTPTTNGTTSLVSCPYFNTSLIAAREPSAHREPSPLKLDYRARDSFTVYIVAEGEGHILLPGTKPLALHFGDTLLLPASLSPFELIPQGSIKIIESYIP